MVNLLVIGPFILYDTLAPVAIRSMYLISSDLLKSLVFSIMPSMLFDITKRTPYVDYVRLRLAAKPTAEAL
jgi:hypothetical protein